MGKNLISRKESFTCVRCGVETPFQPGIERNHCPNCLYSLHVDDKTPGDRESLCKGKMEPATVSLGKRSIYVITHRCLTCGKVIHNKAAPNDNIDLLISLMNASPKLAVGNILKKKI